MTSRHLPILLFAGIVGGSTSDWLRLYHRDAAMEALGRFVSDGKLSADQIEFINLIVDHLTERGVIDNALLWESPFTDIDARGPEALFASSDLTDLLAILNDVRQRATA